MFAFSRPQRLILPLAPSLGGLAGLLFAVFAALIPATMLDSLVTASGIPSVLAVAAPPLGVTARMVMVLVGGSGVALITGLGLFFAIGSRSVIVRHPSLAADLDVPVLRRSDAHPDAPPRRPVFAHRDLGTPFLDIHAEREQAIFDPPARALPSDLDQPLADFDPSAIPDQPRQPVRAVPSLVRTERPQLFDPGDRFETFELTPMTRTASSREGQRTESATRITAPETGATIHALLDRLERGVTRHHAPSSDTFQDSLRSLQRVGAGAA